MKVLNKLALTALLSLSLFATQAQQDTTMIVNGVCGMCQRTIETAVLDLEGAEKASWNKDTKVLKFTYDPQKLSVDQVSDAINASGYDTEYDTAPDSAYFSLHKCCYYRDPQVVKDHRKEK